MVANPPRQPIFETSEESLFFFSGVRKRVVSKRVVSEKVLEPKHRNEGTKHGATVPKTGTRVQKTELWYQKPERGHIRQDRHFTKPPFYKTALLFPLDFSQFQPRFAKGLLRTITLTALQKTFVDFFFEFAWEFCFEKWRGFLVIFFWSPFHTTGSNKKLLKNFGENSEQNSGQNSGRKF